MPNPDTLLEELIPGVSEHVWYGDVTFVYSLRGDPDACQLFLNLRLDNLSPPTAALCAAKADAIVGLIKDAGHTFAGEVRVYIELKPSRVSHGRVVPDMWEAELRTTIIRKV